MIYRNGNIGMTGTHAGMFTFSVGAENYPTLEPDASPRADWERFPATAGGMKIIPFGPSNDLPVRLRDMIDRNNLAGGIFKRQRGLLWGQGPALYEIKYRDGEPYRDWVEDKEIMAWLKTWNYQEYLINCIIDYYHFEVVYSKLFRNIGPRYGLSGLITSLEHIDASDARLIWPEDGKIVKNVMVADFENSYYQNVRVYPSFDSKKPFKDPVSVIFSRVKSAARKYYGVPAYYGAINWIELASSVPRVLEALKNNALSIKWHIISPSSYWTNKEAQLKAKCEAEGKAYNDNMLEDLKDEVFSKLGKVLSGEKNVGKYFASESFRNEFEPGRSELDKWELVPLDMKLKDIIDSQISIANKADSATTSGLGLHPSLSNIMSDGKLASGSEMLYALKLYLATETEIPEMVVCEAINKAIDLNWPDKNLKIGFYHSIVRTEENVSPTNRVKNAI